jgi:hypothetical protein
MTVRLLLTSPLGKNGAKNCIAFKTDGDSIVVVKVKPLPVGHCSRV